MRVPSDLRQRRTTVSQADGTVTSSAKTIPVSLDSGWRCINVTLLILVIANVVIALYVAAVAVDVRKLVHAQHPNVTITAQSGMPRFDTMLAANEVDSFKRNVKRSQTRGKDVFKQP